MKRYGFKSARLAPNLLNVSEDDAIKKAKLMGKFLDLNLQDKFKVTETYFKNMKKLINLEDYFFFFNCNGLSCFPKMELSLNISTQCLSQLCSFVPKASISFKEIAYDIYNPKLWKVANSFIQNRIQALFNNCIDCELIGVCRGGCIYTGLDKENQLNKAACAYQKGFWNIYVKKVFQFEEGQKCQKKYK
jgi:radical SAM protein with 4Fe4S-binding SPASM domain